MSRTKIAFLPLAMGAFLPRLAQGLWLPLVDVRWALLAGGGAATAWLLASNAEGYGSTKLLRGAAVLGVATMLVLSLWQLIQFLPSYWADTAGYAPLGRPEAVINRLAALCSRYPEWAWTWGATAAIAAAAIMVMFAAWPSPSKAGPWTGDFLAPHRVNALAQV